MSLIPSWLETLKAQSLQQFNDNGFPTTQQEEWRYTHVAALKKTRFSLVAHTQEKPLPEIKAWQLEDCYRIVFVDGFWVEELSDVTSLPGNIVVSSLKAALACQPEQIQPYLGKSINSEIHGFIEFNTAYFEDGLLILLPKNTVLDKPLQLLNVVTDDELIAPTRHIIVLEAHSKLELIETFAAVDAKAYFTNAVTEVFLENNAELTVFKLQTEAEKAYHFGGMYVQQTANSRFKQHNFEFGSLLARHEIHSDLAQAAECELNGLFLGSNRQHIDNHTRIKHLKPYGISREYYKGILDQRARGVFQGRIVVAENAPHTDSQMNNRNLLLSNDAEVDTKPQLEIYTDDVKCSHGVTVGQLDEKSIFYLQSRGFDREAAKHVLTFAFANEMVEKVEFEPLKQLLTQQLRNRLPID